MAAWLSPFVFRTTEDWLTEIADYEVRRELPRAGCTKGVSAIVYCQRLAG